MEPSRITVLFLALAVVSEARSLAAPHATLDAKGTHTEKAKVSAVATKVSWQPRVSPPIHTGSDKKFFGPPFPANYPEDKRPVPDKKILDRLKGPDQPYPALQSKTDYDRDYVKDENSDQGDWKAQFEYDTLRKRLAKEAADARAAGDRAGKEGRDVNDAQGAADRAGRDLDDARRGLDDARRGEGDAGKDEDFGGPPSHEKLERLKKAVSEAEENYEKEKKEFEECKRQLEDAKTNLAELKAKQVEMEKQLAAETKLWMETKQVRLNLKKSKEDAAHTKTIAAQERLKAAREAKAEMDKILADKKAHHAEAKKSLDKEHADMAKAQKDLEKATLTLQKLRGYKPVSPEPAKGSASMASALLSLSALLAMHAF